MSLSLDYTQFHEVFRPEIGSPYDQHLHRELESKRKNLGGVLFLDRVLKALGITKVKQTYPPRENNGLHALHRQVCAAKMSPHHKLSVLFYLLLDHDEAIGPRSQLAENFAKQTGTPKKYQIFMRGLWYMDREQFQLALEYLTHPSLLPEFADDIITVLVRRAEGNDYSLPLAYYYAVQPVLKSPEALELLFEAVARTTVTEAYFFTRTHPDPARQQLFQQLISSVLKGSGAQDTATRASELVTLPLDGTEETWFQEYLLTGEGRKLKKAKDTVLMRKIVTGNHESVGEKNPSGPWGVVLQGIKQGMGGRAEQ